MKIERFLCNGKVKSIQVENNPRFRWRIAGKFSQTAYQLVISKGLDIVYDSGMIQGKVKNHTANFSLEELTEYTASLTVYSNTRLTTEKLVFRTALTNGFCKDAKWITAPLLMPSDGGNPVCYFKKEFEVKGKTPAFLYCAGLGLYSIRINGNAISNEVLSQPFTNYSKKIFYGAYEVTPYLREGNNRIEIAVADGWYNQNAKDTWKFWQADWKECNKFILQLQCGTQMLVSDESWGVCTDGVIQRSALRLGEVHDLRKVPSYSQNAIQASAPTARLTARIGNAIKEKEKVNYRKAIIDGEGVLFDFGRNISGYISLVLNAKAGETFEITYGERLKDGKIDNESNSQYIRDEEQRPFFQKDYIICKDGKNTFKPQFVYHGFRYAYVKGLSYIPEKTQITAHFVYTDFSTTGKVSINHSRIMRLQKMVLDSDKANYVGIPTDCPHREKNGWTGDMQASAEQYIYNFNMQEDMRKWLLDIVDCQTEEGAIPCIVPTARNIFGYAWGAGPAWDFAFFEITYQLVERYEDLDILQRVYPYLNKYYEYMESKKDEQGLLCVGLGDWCYPRDIKFPVAPTRLTTSLYFYKMSQYLAYFSSRLFGEDKGYTQKAEIIKLAIDKEFLGENGQVANNSITALAGYLYFLETDETTDALITARLVKEIRKNKYGSFFGILGNKYLHRVLFQRGLGNISLKIWERNEYPSFGYWIQRGAVSMVEDFEDRLSRNHHMYGDISAVFYSCIVGVNYRMENGITHAEIKIPQLKGVSSACASVDTPNGKLSVKWIKEKGKVRVSVRAPLDTVGTVTYKGKTLRLSAQTNTIYNF